MPPSAPDEPRPADPDRPADDRPAQPAGQPVPADSQTPASTAPPRPVPEDTRPVPEDTRPAPEDTSDRPVSGDTRPVPEDTRPTGPTARPAPSDTSDRPVPSASRPAPSDSPDLRRYLAWTTAALPRAFPSASLPLPALRAAWTLAARDIAARLALACARERLVDAAISTDLNLRAATPLRLPLARQAAFGLHRPDLDAPRHPALEHPVDLLGVLALDLPAATLDRLAAELRDSVFNLAVARAIAELRLRARLGGAAWPAPLDPESLVVAGHPWHPMCKTRLGLHHHEVLRHAPEALARADLRAVDVPITHAAASPEFAALSPFPPPAPDHVRIPVHPLQLRRLPRLLGSLWGTVVRPAPLAPISARALLSLRTVELTGLHIKLAADLHTTSARRQVSPMSVHNGPRLGALLDAVTTADPRARRGLRLQHEPAAAGHAPSLGPIAGQLGAILRRDLTAPTHELAREAGHPDAVAWVCAALGERWPGDLAPAPPDMSPRPSPISDAELLHRHTGDPLLRAIASAYPSPTDARHHYIDLLVPPALRLCTAHGVALELHLQNTLVVHHRGRPCGFIVRDLGGVRVHRGRLAAAGHPLDLAPGSFTVTDDLAELQSKLAHTLLHAHLGSVFAWAADLLRLD